MDRANDSSHCLLHKDGASDGHALDEVVLVEGVVDQALDGVGEIVD